MNSRVDENWPARIDELLVQPCWVIDLLPEQVPASDDGQFFAVESWYLRSDYGAELRRKFADVLLKLNCYHDFVVVCDDEDEGICNPDPGFLAQRVADDRGTVNVIVPDQNALVQVTSESTCMALFNPTAELLEQVTKLAYASGLFVWHPGNSQ